jgi:protein TonB
VVGRVERSVVSAVAVTISAPPAEPNEPEPEGAQGDPGREAVATPVAAPEQERPLRNDPPAPRAASTGSEVTAGATEAGDGTGRAGEGVGSGSGEGGLGQGGGVASKPVLTRAITDASAFPVPPGGRQARIGQSVIVRLAVSPQGRATRCSIYRPSPFPETDAAVCRLALEQLRFEPARDARGNPVAAVFYYEQRFFN